MNIKEIKIKKYSRILHVLLVFDTILMIIESLFLSIFSLPDFSQELIEKYFKYNNFIYKNIRGIFYSFLILVFTIIFAITKNKNIKYGICWLFILHATIFALYDIRPLILLLHISELVLAALCLYLFFEPEK